MMSMSIRKTTKRISTLNQEQIAYINGCAILQKAVWRMTHKDPLSALCSQFEIKTIRIRPKRNNFKIFPQMAIEYIRFRIRNPRKIWSFIRILRHA